MKQAPRLRQLALLALLLTAAASPTWAQKAKKPAAPTPTGTIFYETNQEIWAMKPDGSGKTRVLRRTDLGLNAYNPISASPSDGIAGSHTAHDRWWIVPKQTGVYDVFVNPNGVTLTNHKHYDLFAVRAIGGNPANLQWVQLTDLYGIVNFSALSGYWSNDTNRTADSFVGAQAQDLRGAVTMDGGVIRVDLTSVPEARRWARLPLTSTDVQVGWLGNNFEPLGPDSYSPEDLDMVLDMMLTPFVISVAPGHDSPVSDEVASGRFDKVVVLDPAAPNWEAPVRTLWNGDGASDFVGDPQWSRDGSKVAIATGGTSAGGNILLAPASGGSTPQTLLSITSTTSRKVTTQTKYLYPRWSPDSKFMVVGFKQYSNGTLAKQGLVRVTLADGKVQNLGLDTTGYVRPVRWVSDSTAP